MCNRPQPAGVLQGGWRPLVSEDFRGHRGQPAPASKEGGHGGVACRAGPRWHALGRAAHTHPSGAGETSPGESPAVCHTHATCHSTERGLTGPVNRIRALSCLRLQPVAGQETRPRHGSWSASSTSDPFPIVWCCSVYPGSGRLI